MIALFISLTFHALNGQGVTTEETIRHMMAVQEEAWNDGDIPRFMEPYWKSPDLVFLGESGPIYGWQNTLERYYTKYPDRQAMGKLRFSIDDIKERSASVYSVIGQYYLTREGIEDLQGYFMLLIQKIDDQWVIVADSTI